MWLQLCTMSDSELVSGIIYGALHNGGKWYIGSTTCNLNLRRHQHYVGAYSSRRSNRKFFSALGETAEDDWIWGVHEEISGVTRRELKLAETEYQRAFNSVEEGYNACYAALSPEHRDKLNERNFAYRAKNRKQLLAYQVAYYTNNREKINAQKRVYRAINREKVNDQQREHYASNRDKINAQRRLRRAAKRVSCGGSEN